MLEQLIREERERMERMVRDGDREGLTAYLAEYADGLEHSPLE